MLDETADWDMTLAITGIIAATMWLVCALIYMWAFFYEYKHSRDEDRIKEYEELPDDAQEEEEILQVPMESKLDVGQSEATKTKDSPESSVDHRTREGADEEVIVDDTVAL